MNARSKIRANNCKTNFNLSIDLILPKLTLPSPRKQSETVANNNCVNCFEKFKQNKEKKTAINSRQLKTVVIKQKRERNKDFLHTNLVPRKSLTKKKKKERERNSVDFFLFLYFFTRTRCRATLSRP